MNSEIAQAFVRIRPDMRGFRAETEAGTTAAFRGAARSAAKLFGGIFVAKGAVDLLRDLAKAAQEDQAAFAILGRAIDNAGAKSKLFGKDIKEVLESQARLKGFTDEQLAQAMVRLVSVTKNTEQAYKDLSLAQDLSRARHIELTVAALAISKAEQGVTTSLQRYGIVIPKVGAAVADLKKRHDEAVASGVKFTGQNKLQYQAALAQADALDKQARRTQALTLIQQRFGGAAATFAKTSAGQFETLRETIRQAEENIGYALLPSLNKAASGLSQFFAGIAENDQLRKTLAGDLHNIGDGLTFIGKVASTVAPPLLAVAKAGQEVVSSIGAPSLVAAFAVYKGIPAIMGLATAAQARFVAIVGKSAAVSGADAAAKGVEAGATDAAAVSFAALTVAVEANTVATATNAGVTRLALGGFSTFALTAGKAAPALKETAVASVGLRAALAGVGTSMAAALTSTTAMTIGAAALVGGLIYLTRRYSDAGRAAREYRDAVSELDKGLQHSLELQQHLADLKQSSIPTDQTSIAQAKLTVEQDRFALSTTKAAKGSFEYRQLVLNLKRDVQGLGDALRNLAKDQTDVVSTGNQLSAQGAQNVAGFAKIADKVEAARQKAINAMQLNTREDPAQHLARRQNALRDFFKDIDAQAKTPSLQRSIGLIKQFVATVGQLPTIKETKVALSLGSDPGASLTKFLDKLNSPDGKAKAGRAGHSAGVSYSAQFARGVLDGQGLVDAAITQMLVAASNTAAPGSVNVTTPLHRATGGYVPGTGESDNVPALLTPQEIVLNKTQQRTLRAMLGMKQFGSAQELFNKIASGGGGSPFSGLPQLTGAYNEIGGHKGKPVQKFATGGIVGMGGGGESIDHAIARMRGDHYSDDDIAGQLRRWGWSSAAISSHLGRGHKRGGFLHGLSNLVFGEDDVRRDRGGRFHMAEQAHPFQRFGNRASTALTGFSAAQIGGFAQHPLAAAAYNRRTHAFSPSDLVLYQGAIGGSASQAALREARTGIARSNVGGDLFSRRRPIAGQTSLFDEPFTAGVDRGLRVPRATSLARLRDIASVDDGGVPPDPYGLSWWTEEDAMEFPDAIRGGLDVLNAVHGWPDYTHQKSLKFYMETGEPLGHMSPGDGFPTIPGRGRRSGPGGLGVRQIGVRPDETLRQLGFDSLTDRMVATLAHEFGHALDYTALKPRANSRFPGSVAAAMGHKGDPHATELWSQLQMAPSTQRTLGLKASLQGSIAGNGGWSTPAQKKMLEHLDYLLHPAELTARAYTQWITERTRHPAMFASLAAEFMANNVASKGAGDWVFSDAARTPEIGRDILDEIGAGNNSSFAPIANAFEQLFASRGALRGEPRFRADTPPAMAAAASRRTASVVGSHNRIQDLMATRTKGPTARERAEAAAAERRAIAASVGGEFFSHEGILAPRVVDPAERAAIGFPGLPKLSQRIQRDIAREAERISGLTFPKTEKMKGFTSAAALGLPSELLGHRLGQAIQGAKLMGPRAPFWYEDQGPYVRGLSKREDISGLASAQALAITSAQAPPSPDNIVKAVLGIRQTQNLGPDAHGLITDIQRRKIGEALRGEPWSTGALKTTNFYPNLYTGAYGVNAAKKAGLDPFAVTNDVHVARGLWPGREDPKFNNLGEYLLATEFNKSVQRIMGYELPMHGQASYWSALRAISELTRPVGQKGHINTWEDAVNDPAGSYRSGFNLTNAPLTNAAGIPYPGTQPRAGARLADLEARRGFNWSALDVRAQRRSGVPVVPFRSNKNADLFNNLLERNTRGLNLTKHTAEELASSRMFLTPDRAGGFVIDPGGDLQNVFKNIPGRAGLGQAAVLSAIRRGARTLDAYDGFLPPYYSKFGFSETGRMRWNDEFAPPGWDYGENGKPDVVFMAYQGGNPAKVARRSAAGIFGHQKSDNYFDDWDTAKQFAAQNVLDRDKAARAAGALKDAARARARLPRVGGMSALRRGVRDSDSRGAGQDLEARRTSLADLFAGVGRGDPDSPLTALGLPRKEVPTSVPGIVMRRKPKSENSFGWASRRLRAHDRGVEVNYELIDTKDPALPIGDIATTWYKHFTNVDSAYLEEPYRNTKLFWDMARVATDRGLPIQAEVVNTKLGKMMMRLAGRVPQLKDFAKYYDAEWGGGNEWRDSAGDYIPDLFAAGGVVGGGRIPLGRYGVGNEIGHDRPGVWTVRGSNGASIPMRRNIAGWLEKFKGRGLSPALALDAAKWWSAHWPAQRRFATGGIAAGAGSGDTVPAMLTPGEIVFNRGAQARLGAMIGMPGADPHSLFSAVSGHASRGASGRFAAGGVAAGGPDWLAQATPASAYGLFSQVLKMDLAPTVNVKPHFVVDSTSAGQLRTALTGVLENVYQYSAAEATQVLAGKTKDQLVTMYEALVGPLGSAAKKGITDPIGAAIDLQIKNTKQGLNAFRTQEQQTISGMKEDLSNLQTSLADQIKQTALDVQSAVDSAKQNLTGLASSMSSFIDAYIDKPLQNEQTKLTEQQNKLTLNRLRQSVLLPGGKTLAADPTKALGQLRKLAKDNPTTRLAFNDFITQQYQPAALAVKQDQANRLKAATDRQFADLTYQLNTGKITSPQYERRVKRVLRRAGYDPARAQSLLGVAAAGTFGETENAAFAQAKLISGGPQGKGSGAVGALIRPLDVLHRDQQQTRAIQKQIGQQQIALQKEIAKSTAKTAAQTTALAKLQAQRDRHGGSSKSRNTGKSNDVSTEHSGTTK